MINESDGRQDSQDDKEDQETDYSPADPMLGQLEGVIGGAIKRAVSQYRALLSQGLESEVKRIVTEFEVATEGVDRVVANQTRSRLTESTLPILGISQIMYTRAWGTRSCITCT